MKKIVLSILIAGALLTSCAERRVAVDDISVLAYYPARLGFNCYAVQNTGDTIKFHVEVGDTKYVGNKIEITVDSIDAVVCSPDTTHISGPFIFDHVIYY